MKTRCCAAVALGAVISLLTPAAQAAFPNTTWTINPALSSITLDIPQQVVPIELSPGAFLNLLFRARNQVGDSPWTTGNTSALSGTFQTLTNFNTTIQFVGGVNNIDGTPSGTWSPGIGGVGASDPADFGVKLQAADPDNPDPFEDAANGAIRDALYDISSSAIAVAGGQFAATNLNVGVLSGNLDYDGIGIFDGLLAPGTTTIPATSAANSGAGQATISLGLTTASLTIPINLPVSIAVNQNVSLQATFLGSIVATTVLPHAGDANFDGIVNLVDVQVVGGNWNGTAPIGDVNYDGVVNLVDVQVVGGHWQHTGPNHGAGAGSAVPEPGSLALLGVGAGLWSLAVWRRRRAGRRTQA